MALFERLTAVGKDMGLTGKDLAAFVIAEKEKEETKLKAEQEREKEREDREKEREDRKRKEDQEREDKIRKENQEREDRLMEREIQREAAQRKHELELRKIMANSTTTGTECLAKTPKLPPFVEGKDEIDSYLLRFERFAETNKWSKDGWASKLSALLSGKALDVYSRLSTKDATDYNKLRQAVLRRYGYTEDGYRTRFRQSVMFTHL